MGSCVLAHIQLFVPPWPGARQAPLFMGFSKQEYWSGLSCPSSENLPNPGIKPPSAASLELAVGFFTTEPPGNPFNFPNSILIILILGTCYLTQQREIKVADGINT